MTNKFLRLIACVAVLAGLSACSSFAPVYGERSDDALRSARFNFGEPSTRVEQIIINRLKIAFPGDAEPEDPILDVTATVTGLPAPISSAFSAARPVNIRVQAEVTIVRDDETLLSETRFADSSYQGGKLTPTDIYSRAGLEERVAEAVAEALRAALIARLTAGDL